MKINLLILSVAVNASKMLNETNQINKLGLSSELPKVSISLNSIGNRKIGVTVAAFSRSIFGRTYIVSSHCIANI